MMQTRTAWIMHAACTGLEYPTASACLSVPVGRHATRATESMPKGAEPGAVPGTAPGRTARARDWCRSPVAVKGTPASRRPPI